MTVSIRKVALLGATGKLGSHILTALIEAGFEVIAVQRKDSPNTLPDGINSVQADLTKQDDLMVAFKGQDAVVSAVPTPKFATEKIMIDAALGASVKRIIPSEYTTNLDSPLSRQLPIAQQKLQVRHYLESLMSNTSCTTTWTSINTGPFFEVCLGIGALGPNLVTKTATFHNGGGNLIGVSRWKDIGKAVATVLQSPYIDETANQAVYIYSAAVNERMITDLASKITGIDFGTIEGGQIANVDVDRLMQETDEKWKKGDMSVAYNYFYQTMYGKGYGGGDFEVLSWNKRLGLKTMTDDEIEEFIGHAAKVSAS